MVDIKINLGDIRDIKIILGGMADICRKYKYSVNSFRI